MAQMASNRARLLLCLGVLLALVDGPGCVFNSPAPEVSEQRGSKKSRPRKRRDFSGRPVQILHPSKVMRGRSKARWQDVFRVWEREIPKPDFAIHHAAKAVRLLPKVNFRGLPPEEQGGHPVLQTLLRRTKELLQMDNCTVVVTRPEPGQRSRREGLCAEDVAAMIRAAENLAKALPQLRRELLPALQQKVSSAVSELTDKDVVGILLAGSWDSVPEVWAQFLARLRPQMVDVIDAEELPALIRLLCVQPDTVAAAKGGREEDQSAQLLLTLREEVPYAIPALQLSDLASCFWSLADVGLVDRALQNAVTELVAKEAASWKRKKYDPALWQLLYAYARMNAQDLGMLKATARLAIREEVATQSNWALSVLHWSYAKLADDQDGLEPFRKRVEAEVSLRQLSSEAPPPWSEDLEETWLQRRVDVRPHQIAPRPVKLLQRLSREEDARREREVRKLIAQPNWRELDTDDGEDEELSVTDIEEFRLFDLTEDDAEDPGS